MTVMQLSKSKKSVRVITEEGDVFITSVGYLRSLIDDKLTVPFLLMNRLPNKVAPDRFKPSPIFGEELQKELSEPLTTTNDALSVKSTEKREMEKSYTDKVIEW